jgi:hypothetical protein
MIKRQPSYQTIKQWGGTIYDVCRFVYPNNKNWGATNPSIGHHPDKGFVVSIRSSNYIIEPNGAYTLTEGSTIKSHVWFAELNAEMKAENLRKVDVSDTGFNIERGLEDPKLLWRDDAWHFTCVIMERGHTPAARMAIAKLDPKCEKIVSFNKLKGIDYSRPEKNWMLPHEPSKNFDFIYGPNQVIKDNKMTTWMTDNTDISSLRGNSNLHLVDDGTYLGVMHRTFVKSAGSWAPTGPNNSKNTIRSYIHYFVQFDKNGMIKALSEGFIFHKDGIEFAAGFSINNGKAFISFGIDDVSSHIAELPVEVVLKSLQPVKY